MTLCTEEAAKECWCPFGRTVTRYGDNVANRGEDEAEWTMCIASKCMAWRWRYQDRGNVDNVIVGPPLSSHGTNPDRWLPLGFCGLAGPHD